jgi:hypothetical protein
MTHAVVTLEISPKQRLDLALPLNVPNHVLAPAMAKALEMPNDGEGTYLLNVKTENGIVRLSANTTLGEAGVLDGFVLQIQRRAGGAAPVAPEIKSTAFLQVESGEVFPLNKESISIGRRDVKRGGMVDIDLTPFDSGKTASRRHAVIEGQAGKYLLRDQDSVNGTWVNNQRLDPRQPHPLQEGDIITFGRNGVQLKFMLRK